jgi:nicotinamidase/pyrazinamidase
VLTQDWHPANHTSFATSHPGKRPFETIELAYGAQTLWPSHCVQGTQGADFHVALHLPQAELIVRKGFRPEIDSYSAFFENDRATPTGLAGYLRERCLTRLFFAGLAYDYCVGYSALDARRLGFTSVVLRDACRAIDLDGSAAAMDAQLVAAEVAVLATAQILEVAAREHAGEGIRQGLMDAETGRIRPAKEFFDEFENGQSTSR